MENPSALLSYHIGYPGATGLIMIFSFYFVCVPVTGWKDRRPKENGPRGKGVSFPRGVGTTILGAAVIDDIMGIIVLTVVTSIEDTSVNPFTVLLKIVLYFIVIAIVAFVMFKCKKLIEGAGEKRRVTIFAIAFCFLLSYVSEQFFGIADITGAYFAGLMLCNMKIGDYIKARAD